MKIIVSHVYSNDNKGDAALLSVLLSDIRRAFDGAQITILTLDKAEKDETFEGVPIKNSFMYYAREGNAVFVAAGTLLSALIYRITGKNIPLSENLQEVVKLYEEADLVIPVGGGYIRSQAGFMSTMTLFFIIHPFLFSALLGKPTIGYTQSVGPFGNKFQEIMAKFAVKRLDGIIVRENISLQLLKKWGIAKNVFVSVDSGFSFASESVKDIRKELEIPEGKMLVGVTVRDWLKSEGQVKYEKTVAALCDHIIKKYDAYIIFIPQVTVESHRDDDRESGKRVYALMENKKSAHVVVERYDHKTIKAIYAKLDYLVGTRFHSVIFALTSHVPSIAIGYEHKTQGIMVDLGLEKWATDIRKIQIPELISLFDSLVVSRNQYINQLKKILPPYVERSQKSIYFVKEVYQQSQSLL